MVDNILHAALNASIWKILRQDRENSEKKKNTQEVEWIVNGMGRKLQSTKYVLTLHLVKQWQGKPW